MSDPTGWAVRGPDGVSLNTVSITRRMAAERRLAAISAHATDEGRARAARDLEVVPVTVSVVESK